jgi:hypothetical protein
MMGMATCGESPTASPEYTYDEYYLCNKCNCLKWECICWMFKMGKLAFIEYMKSKLDIYKFIVKKSIWISITILFRKILHCISGCKGLKLLEKLDKI